MVVDLGFGEAVGQPERAVEPDVFGKIGEQLVDRLGADLGQHLLALSVG